MARTIDPRVDIGHVHLKVSDIDRALGFYRDVLGFDVTQRYGDEAAFVSAGGYHHHLGLNTWESRGASPPPAGTTGLYHVAIRYPDRATLGDALRRLREAGIPISGNRPRRQRGHLPARSGWKRNRALPRPTPRGVATGARRGGRRDVQRSARPRG